MRTAASSPELQELAPKGNARLGANPHANGGLLLKDLRLPDFRKYGIEVDPGKTKAQDMIELGGYNPRHLQAQRGKTRTSVSLGLTRACPTACTRSSRPRTAIGTPRPWIPTRPWPATAASWTPCSASTCAKAGWKATCSPAAMASLPATRPSSASWTPWLPSTPSG